MRVGGLATVATAIILGVALLQGGGGGPWDGLANIWVDGGTGTCVWSQSTPAAYSSATACTDLQEAYVAAGTTSGGTVGVKDTGSSPDYPTQNMSASGTKTGQVLFRPAPGETVTFGQVNVGKNTTVGPHWASFRDFAITDLGVKFTNDVTLTDLDTGIVNAAGMDRFSWIGGDAGPWTDGVNNLNTCTGTVPTECIDNVSPTDVLIDGVYFHDYLISDPAPHAECLQINGTGSGSSTFDGLTIRNSTFQNCTDYGILSADNLSDVLIENNFFDEPFPGAVATTACSPSCPRNGYSIDLDSAGHTITNATIQYNSMLGFSRVRDSGTLVNVVIRSNSGKKTTCTGSQTYTKNTWDNVSCGTDNSPVAAFWSSLWLDGDPSDGSMNFHLAGGANALVGAGDTGNFPTLDIDGDTRTSPPDVGADER